MVGVGYPVSGDFRIRRGRLYAYPSSEKPGSFFAEIRLRGCDHVWKRAATGAPKRKFCICRGRLYAYPSSEKPGFW
jgi:hypothetical protein